MTSLGNINQSPQPPLHLPAQEALKMENCLIVQFYQPLTVIFGRNIVPLDTRAFNHSVSEKETQNSSSIFPGVAVKGTLLPSPFGIWTRRCLHNKLTAGLRTISYSTVLHLTSKGIVSQLASETGACDKSSNLYGIEPIVELPLL